jgi:hypothetical protein
MRYFETQGLSGLGVAKFKEAPRARFGAKRQRELAQHYQ